MMNSVNLVVKPRLRIYTIEIVWTVIGIGFLFYLLANYPTHGIRIYELLHVKWEWLKDLLRFRITYDHMEKAVLTLSGLLVLHLFILWIKARSMTYTFNNKFMTIDSGILTRRQDCIDMIDLRDEQEIQTLPNRLIGVSVVNVISVDKTNPELHIKLAKPEAFLVMEFLKSHSTRSIVDYQLTRDMRGQNGRRIPRPNEIMNTDDKDDGGSQDSE